MLPDPLKAVKTEAGIQERTYEEPTHCGSSAIALATGIGAMTRGYPPRDWDACGYSIRIPINPFYQLLAVEYIIC
jgi:hypothetical protein